MSKTPSGNETPAMTWHDSSATTLHQSPYLSSEVKRSRPLLPPPSVNNLSVQYIYQPQVFFNSNLYRKWGLNWMSDKTKQRQNQMRIVANCLCNCDILFGVWSRHTWSGFAIVLILYLCVFFVFFSLEQGLEEMKKLLLLLLGCAVQVRAHFHQLGVS